MGVCRDCQWWDELPTAQQALCLFLSTSALGQAQRVLVQHADHPAWALSAEGFTAGELWTTATFGCNQFAPREGR